MDRRSFLQTLAVGLASAAAEPEDDHVIELGSDPDPERGNTPAPQPASRVRFIPKGPTSESSWAAVCLGMTGLRVGDRGFWIGDYVGNGWWSVKAMTTTGGTKVRYEPGILFLGERRVALGQLLRERDLDMEA